MAIDSLSWRGICPDVQAAVHQAQVPWIGTRYSGHQQEIGCGVGCYRLMGAILDRLYDKPEPTIFPDIGIMAGACSDKGAEMVRTFLKSYPLIDTSKASSAVEPGDLIVTRCLPGFSGPDWMGHAMMAGTQPGQVIHAVPKQGVVWGSLAGSIGRVVRIYRPQNKETWAWPDR